MLNDKAIDQIADALIEYQKRENTALPILRGQLKDVEKRIKNMLDAIEQGVVNEFTKQRMEELGERKADLEIAIAQEQLDSEPMTKEQIVLFFSRFKNGDVNDPDYRRHVINIFVNAFHVHDDHGVLLINTKDGVKTVTLDMLEGSDLADNGPPKYKRKRRTCKGFRRFLYFAVIYGCFFAL